MKKIVIVGGGAGGLELTIGLARRLGMRASADITLVDRKMTHMWKPLFHEVAAGTRGHSGDEVSYLSLARMHGFRFRTGNLIAIDKQARTLVISSRKSGNGKSIPERILPFDILVLALGSESRTFRTPGVEENCFFLDTLDQSHRFRSAFFEHCLRIDTYSDPSAKMLDLTIIGGGATGVELAAELTHAVSHLTRYGFDAFAPSENVRIRLVEASTRLLPALEESVSALALSRLNMLGVDVLTSCRVAKVTNDSVHLSDGSILPSHMTAWVAGIGAPSAMRNIEGLPLTASGFLEVGPTLQLAGTNDMFAIGDCAANVDRNSGKPLPPKAQVASQQAEHLAYELCRMVRKGTTPRPFVFQDKGSLVNIGAHSTVGQLMGNLMGTVTLDGWLARRAYRYLYRRHQLVVHGRLRGSILIASEFLRDRVHPRLKLH